ncbi:MAG: hypothetical protein ACREDR_18225 [Blastocatellia bacterium]
MRATTLTFRGPAHDPSEMVSTILTAAAGLPATVTFPAIVERFALLVNDSFVCAKAWIGHAINTTSSTGDVRMQSGDRILSSPL